MRFIDIAENSNLSALIISGYPTPEELFEAWEKINIEFADAMGNSGHKLYAITLKEYSLLSITWKQVCALIETLRQGAEFSVFPLPLYAELNKLTKSDIKFTADNKEANIAGLNRCYNRAKSIKINLDLKKMQLDALEPVKSPDGTPLTKKSVVSILITLSNHAGYNVPDSITVFEFTERLRRNNEYAAELERQYKNKK